MSLRSLLLPSSTTATNIHHVLTQRESGLHSLNISSLLWSGKCSWASYTSLCSHTFLGSYYEHPYGETSLVSISSFIVRVKIHFHAPLQLKFTQQRVRVNGVFIEFCSVYSSAGPDVDFSTSADADVFADIEF